MICCHVGVGGLDRMEVCSQLLVRGSRCDPAHFEELHGSRQCRHIMAACQTDWAGLGAHLQRGEAKPGAAAVKTKKATCG